MKNKLRITKHVNIDDVSNCWEWNRSVNSAGYGQLMEKSKYWLAHRYSYEAFVGDIPDGEIVRHMCHNTKCCNPDHLKTGTQKDNYHDSAKIHKEANKKRRKDWVIDGVWKDCQVKGSVDGWQHCSQHPAWWCATEYRRKPKTHIVHGVEIPDLRFTPKSGETYYHPFPYSTELVARTHYDTSHAPDTYRNEHGLCYEYSSEGRQAAIAHTKAWLGIA